MPDSDKLTTEVRVHFFNQFRDARLQALRDAEGFYDILYCLERLGYQQAAGEKVKKRNGGCGYPKGLDDYYHILRGIAASAALYLDPPKDGDSKETAPPHPPFEALFDSVKEARNDALHQGAYARHLTHHCVQLALIMEDALMSGLTQVSHFMVRNPMTAEPWHPISFVRQQMLEHSFSYLPVFLTSRDKDGKVTGEWCLVSEFLIAQYLRSSDDTERKARLAKTLEHALGEELRKHKARWVRPNDKVSKILGKLKGGPVLVLEQVKATDGKQDIEEERLVGILTAFDLL